MIFIFAVNCCFVRVNKTHVHLSVYQRVTTFANLNKYASFYA